MLKKQIEKGLKELHLPVIRDMYEPLAKRALAESTSFEQYLLWLIEQEQETRRVRRIERRLEESKLPLSKNLQSFNLKRLPSKIGSHVKSLLSGDFIRQKENLLIFGNPGSGKTHLLCGIAQELIRKYDLRLLFISSSKLLQDLLAAKRDLYLPRLIKRLTNYNGLIIDDIGYVQQNKEEVEVLFTLISECYERTSLLVTSNLPFSKWDKIFKDQMMTVAAVDRLIHHSVILEMNVSSYRIEQSKERVKNEVA